MSRVRRSFLLILAGFGWMLASAKAADENQVIFPRGSGGATAPAVPSTGGIGFVTVAAIIVLAGAGGWMLWKGKKVNLGGRETTRLAIEESRSLGNRQYLVVASYEGKKFLLGVCPGRIDLLSPLAASDRKDISE
ncbi:MAG TPA: flagellar biosynthetic protein FliO [Opitutaceae bacterium]|nr:flagellar biosynthetic protein FliO [Opitutaceae bacterium]